MTRDRTRLVLGIVEREIVAQCLHAIGDGGRPTMAMVVGGADDAEESSFVQVLDIRDRFRILADAVRQRAADLCVFVYDGWLEDPLGRPIVSRRDALLVVALSRWQADSRAYAIPYEFHEGKGALRHAAILSPEHIETYAQIFGARLEP